MCGKAGDFEMYICRVCLCILCANQIISTIEAAKGLFLCSMGFSLDFSGFYVMPVNVRERQSKIYER